MHGPSHSFGPSTGHVARADSASRRKRNLNRRRAVQHYWLNRDTILAQRRAAYARLNKEIRRAAEERESAAAELAERKVRKRAYYLKNRAKIIAKSNEWNRLNKERIRARRGSPEARAKQGTYRQAWAAKNPERLRKMRAAFYQRHRARLLRLQIAYSIANREAIRERARQKRAARDDSFFHMMGAADTIRRAILTKRTGRLK